MGDLGAAIHPELHADQILPTEILRTTVDGSTGGSALRAGGRSHGSATGDGMTPQLNQR